MNAQEIYQKRINEESNTFVKHTVSQGHGHCTEFYARRKATLSFREGANYILENLWIPVNEALPIEDEPVFIAIKEKKEDDTKFNVAFFDKEIGWFVFGFGQCDKITHWMPIPSLKGGEK